MKFRSLVTALVWIAMGVSASCAFAGSSIALSDDDSAAVFGSVRLTSMQDIGGNVTLGASAAALGANALHGASGNIGVNLAAGALNVQANQIALINTPQADISTQQNVHTVAQLTGNSTAELGAGALSRVSGNVGVNLASGVGNAQLNGLVVH
ncbi:hypothetical protein [Paraburkholderia fungorum]|uniref:hypothetical protein n=1 Tax=Paraburkholderia fungorum TaxID=134537 RepID=UPI0038BD5140